MNYCFSYYLLLHADTFQWSVRGSVALAECYDSHKSEAKQEGHELQNQSNAQQDEKKSPSHLKEAADSICGFIIGFSIVWVPSKN